MSAFFLLLVMPCLPITLIKCLKSHKFIGLLFVGVLQLSLSLSCSWTGYVSSSFWSNVSWVIYSSVYYYLLGLSMTRSTIGAAYLIFVLFLHGNFFGPIFFHAKALSVVSVTNMRYELTLWGQVKVWWYTLYTLYKSKTRCWTLEYEGCSGKVYSALAHSKNNMINSLAALYMQWSLAK